MGDGLVCEILEEGQDFLVELFARARPTYGSSQDLGALPDVGKAEVLGAPGAQIIDFLLEPTEKEQLEAITSLPGRPRDRESEGRGEELQIFGDGIATDATQHTLHALKEVFDGKKAPRALVLQIVQNAVSNIVYEWKILSVTALRCPLESSIDPDRVVTGNLVAADLEDWKFSDEADHDGAIL